MVNQDIKILRDDGLTLEEGEVMDCLIAAWSAFIKLDQQQPGERSEFAVGINKCQDLLALRIVRREYPKGWPIKLDQQSPVKEDRAEWTEISGKSTLALT